MNPIIINEKNFNRFAKRLQKIIAEKTQNQYAPGLMESQELLSQIFGVQSLHEMKKMLELIAESEKKVSSKIEPLVVPDEIESFDPFNPDSHSNKNTIAIAIPKRFKPSALSVQQQTETLLEKMEKESHELEQWMQDQKRLEVTNQTIFIQEKNQAYGNPGHGITVSNQDNAFEKAKLKELHETLDKNNLNDNWRKSGYVLGCFVQAIKNNEIVDISMPFDWIEMDTSQADGNEDVTQAVRPLTSNDLKKIIGPYKEYLQENNMADAQMEVRTFYASLDNIAERQVEQIVQMVSDKKKPLKIR